jgi:GAF domain-containing protein
MNRKEDAMPTPDFFHRYHYALSEIHGSFDLATTQEAVVRNAALLFRAKGAGLVLFTPDEDALIVSAAFGLSESYRSKGALSPSRSLGETAGRTPVVVRDVAADPRVQYRDAALQEGIRGMIGLPLTGGCVLLGALRLYFAAAPDFPPEEMATLEAFAVQAGLALKKAVYFASMKEAAAEIQAMPAMEHKAALEALLRTVARYARARGSALLLLDPKTRAMGSVVRFGLSEQYRSKGPVFAGVSLGEIEEGRPVIVSDAASDPRVQYKEAAAAEGVKAILGLPVRIGTEVAGALRLYYPFEFQPDADYIVWMEHLAHQAGTALEKARMLIRLKEKSDWYEEMLRHFER